MPTGCVMCKMGACWTVATQSICLQIFYNSFLHACWCCVYLFAIPACMVSHYQPCLLVWSLIIAHAFWCDASLSAMPSGVLSHHRPRLLVWSLIINHAYWCGASLYAMSAGQLPLQPIFYKLSADRRMATNMVLLVKRCHHIRHVC